MQIYKEIKEIAKCNSKIRNLAEKLEDKLDVSDVSDVKWETAHLVTLNKKEIQKLDNAFDEYYCEQYQGYIEDDFYGYLYFKTDVPGQFVKVAFGMY